MNRSHHKYSVNSAEELAGAREAAQAPFLAEFHRLQFEAHRSDAYRRVENLKILAAELVDLLDVAQGGPGVDLGSLGKRLRTAEA
jgi:hypothetical protein